MTVIFQSHHQFEFCDKILRSFAEDDGESLLVATSSQEVSLASLKMLQIFSPLLREIVETLPSTSTPHILIIPDADAESWNYLTALLTDGNVDVNLPSDNSNIQYQKDKISSLAQCLRLNLDLETKQVSEEARIKLRVKRPEELMDGSIYPPISYQENNIVNNDYDSDKEEEKVPIKSEKFYSNNFASSELNFPIKEEINESDKIYESGGGGRCNDSGIDIESCLGIEEVINSHEEGWPEIPPQLEKKLKTHNQESLGDPEIIDKKQNNEHFFVDSIVGKENSIETFSGHMSEGEYVSSDEAQGQSFSNDSKSIVDYVTDKDIAAKAYREELRLRWKKKDESISPHANSKDKFVFGYNKDKNTSVDQDDNTKICTPNLQDKVSVEVKRLELELKNVSSQEKDKKKRKPRRARQRKLAKDKNTYAVADSQYKTVLLCHHKKCKGLKFHSGAALKRHNKIHVNEKEKDPQCSRCLQVFKHADSLFSHMNAAHFKIRMPYECSECPGNELLGPPVFVSRKQLVDHLKSVHSMRIKRGGYSFENESASFLYQTEACHKT